MDNKPLLILWDPRFTPQHPFYRFSHNPETTKQQMAKDLVGIDIPAEANDSNNLVQLILPKQKAVLYLGTWEQFLLVATPKQVADVKGCLEHLAQHGTQGFITIPDGPHGII